MEEADALGDWIAIMSQGHLDCYGTPMFLKKKYGISLLEVELITCTLNILSKTN